MSPAARSSLSSLREALHRAPLTLADPTLRREVAEALDEVLEAGAVLVDEVPSIDGLQPRTLRFRARAFASVEGQVRHGDGANPTRLAIDTRFPIEGGTTIDVAQLLLLLLDAPLAVRADETVTLILVLPPGGEA